MDDMTRLLVQARDGDGAALTQWLRRAQPEVWRLCAHLVDRDSADDLTQETFIRAYNAMKAFRAESSGRTWLLSIARRTCADEIRRRTRRRRLQDRIEPQGHAELGPAVVVADLLAGLDEDRRIAFALTQIIGLSYAETAEVCGCAVGTIRSRVARARMDLVAMLDGDFGTGEGSGEVLGNF